MKLVLRLQKALEPFPSSFLSWMFTSALTIMSCSAENEMPKNKPDEINVFYLVLYLNQEIEVALKENFYKAVVFGETSHR